MKYEMKVSSEAHVRSHTLCCKSIEMHNNNLIDTKYRFDHHQMALRSVPTSDLLEPLVKQK